MSPTTTSRTTPVLPTGATPPRTHTARSSPVRRSTPRWSGCSSTATSACCTSGPGGTACRSRLSWTSTAPRATGSSSTGMSSSPGRTRPPTTTRCSEAAMTTLGTTLFSLTPEWRRGADAAALLERLAAVGCGPAIEVIGYQAWRGFPAISADDERAFRSAVDAHGLRPVALGVYTDLFRRPGRPMTEDDAFEDIAPQLAAAARLGFAQVRAPLGMADGLLRRVVDEAERLGLVVTVEVQGTNAPDSPPV